MVVCGSREASERGERGECVQQLGQPRAFEVRRDCAHSRCGTRRSGSAGWRRWRRRWHAAPSGTCSRGSPADGVGGGWEGGGLGGRRVGGTEGWAASSGAAGAAKGSGGVREVGEGGAVCGNGTTGAVWWEVMPLAPHGIACRRTSQCARRVTPSGVISSSGIWYERGTPSPRRASSPACHRSMTPLTSSRLRERLTCALAAVCPRKADLVWLWTCMWAARQREARG